MFSLILAATLMTRPAEAVFTMQGCPATDRMSRGWVEHIGPPPAEILSARPSLPLAASAPMLLPIQGPYYWVGISHRTDKLAGPAPDPGCFVTGSAAIYFVGPEGEPQIDFMKAVRENEGNLFPRLVEVRWFDSKDGLRHRWFNAPLARRLGWLTGPGGENRENDRPIPVPHEVVNTLY